MAIRDRLNETAALVTMLRRAGLMAPLRPDKYVRIVAAMARENFAPTCGFASAAQRCPDRPGLVDEHGTLTWRQLDQRCNSLSAAFQSLPTAPKTFGVMCRNHRGFVESVVAANRIGANLLLLNTSFAGPALGSVIAREGADVLIYDEEFTETANRALVESPDTIRIIAWADNSSPHEMTIDKLIDRHEGQQPKRALSKGQTILLTSGTTGAPKGAKMGSGEAGTLKALLERTPWRAEESVVIAAPMFHAWGFSQLLFAAMMACTIVTRRKFDPQATLKLLDEHRASGVVLVPVMFDRIMDLPDEVRKRHGCRSLRFAAASGSRMRSDVVIKFMDEFGDVVVNNYNATEAGLIASATPEDLRAAPDTAGKPVPGTEVRILDKNLIEVPTGEVGQIFVRSGTLFGGYTSSNTKQFHDGFMASGDMGYLDENGRLFVVGRDDEMIVSGGENVYPIEVENTLLTHPEVAEAAVLGVDDQQYGQRLAAFVVLEPGASATEDDLNQHVRENLANYKVPRVIVMLDELPRGATGKILRNDLRAHVVN